MFYSRKKVIRVWNDMSANTWQNISCWNLISLSWCMYPQFTFLNLIKTNNSLVPYSAMGSAVPKVAWYTGCVMIRTTPCGPLPHTCMKYPAVLASWHPFSFGCRIWAKTNCDIIMSVMDIISLARNLNYNFCFTVIAIYCYFNDLHIKMYSVA